MDQDLNIALFGAAGAVWPAPREKSARNTTASRTAKLLSPVAPGSRCDSLSTETSLAPWQRLGAVIRGVRTWFFISAIAGIAVGCLAGDQAIPAGAKADRVVVVKKERTLTLMSQGKILKTYKIALGGEPVGPKTRQGDHKTPEGVYVLDRRNAHSQFYRAIHVSYPDAHDRVLARKLGVSAGGEIYVHGLPNGYSWIGSSHRLKDWTDGCIAVTNEEMDEIWRAVPDGTPIEIKP